MLFSKVKILLVFVFFFFFFFSYKLVLATPYCTGSMARDFDDLTSGPGGANNFGVFGRTTSLQFEIIGLVSSDQILERYIFDGQGGWASPDSFRSYIGGDYQQKVKIYTNTGQVDFTVGGVWVYRDSSGLIKTITCSTCLRMFDTRETKNFGTTRLTYSSPFSTSIVTVTGSKPYVGLASFPNSPRGNNNGDYPYRTSEVWYDNEIYSWGLNARESAQGYRYSAYGWLYDNEWTDDGQMTPYSEVRYPNTIPLALNFDLKSAQFSAGQGTGAYADYYFDGGLIYSRDLQQNADGTCGSLPAIPTPACSRVVSGTVINQTNGTGYPGAEVTLWTQTGVGGYLNEKTVTTNDTGDWSALMNVSGIDQIIIRKTQNASNLTDGSTLPVAPACATSVVKDNVNQIRWLSNPPCTSCGDFVFYSQGTYLSPTPTLPPIATCANAGFYTQGLYREGNTPKTLDTMQCAPFTPSSDGGVNGILVQAGAWAGTRQIACKVQNNAKTVDISTLQTSSSFSGAADWRSMSFSGANEFTLGGATPYQLCCQQASFTGNVYWQYNNAVGEANGKSYSICMNYTTPVPTCAPVYPDTPTLSTPANLATINADNVNLTWQAVNWGSGCPNTNEYKVYFSTTYNGGDMNDDDLTPDLVASGTITLAKTPLVDGTYYWQVEANNGGTGCGGSLPCLRRSDVRSFTIDTTINPWRQTTGGDLHADSSITSEIPACATSTYLSKDGGGGSPGVVSWGGTDPVLDSGSLSTANWQAKTTYSGTRQTFAYIANRFGIDRTETYTGQLLSTLTDGTYYSTVGRNISGSFTSGRKIVIFVNGNVEITDDIIVPSGSFFALISSGSITFHSAVTKAQGFFLADGQIITEASGGTDVAFEGQGSFVAWNGFDFNRTLANNCTPAETFLERPDLIYNAPSSFNWTKRTFQEVAP